jgi:hypothetical protein
MEDRRTVGLYLETSDLDPDGYATTRVPEVLGLPGVARATWWENVVPDRTDLPRVLDEFSLLGAFEVDETFTTPPPTQGIVGSHFVATARPGQGCLTGRPTIGLSLVLISPREPDQAQALRDWGDFVHIRHIAAAGVPGYTMITPYEHADGGDPRFLHLYEIDRDDPEAVFAAMTPLVAQRFGGYNTAEYRAWAQTPELRIMYVNTFRLLGSRTVGAIDP